MAANNIIPVKTTRKIPKYLYNIDKERYRKDFLKIIKIEKAKLKKKKGKKNNLKIKNA